MATTNDRARRRLASLQKQLKAFRTSSNEKVRIRAAIKLLHSDQAARKAGTATSNERRGAALKARSQSASTTTRRMGKTTVARRKPAKKVSTARGFTQASSKAKLVKTPLKSSRTRPTGVPKATLPTRKAKPATKITKPLPKTVNRNKPKNLMSDRRGTSVPAAEQRKFQKEQELKARSKAAHQSPTARRATAAETKRKAFEKKHGKGMKPVPTRPPSRGAVAGARIGKAVKAKGKAAIAAFRKKVIAAKRAADARKRNRAGHRLKKIPTRR